MGLTVNATVFQSARVYDLRDFGAVAGDVADTALARAMAEIPAGPAVLNIADQYQVSKTLWVTRGELMLKGAGRGVSGLTATSGFHGHMIVMSLNTTLPGGVPTASHFVPLDTYGDGTLTGCTGLRMSTDQILAAWSGPLDQPIPYNTLAHRGWGDFPQLTITYLLDDHNQPLPAGPLYGMGEALPHGYQPRPFHLIAWGSSSWLEFRFATDESPDNYRSFIFAEGVPSGAKRIVVQLDLINCLARAWVNKTQVLVYPYINMGPTSSQTRLLSFSPSDKLRLICNDYHPFLIGAYGSGTQSRGGAPVMDLTVAGYAVSKGLLFADDGVGKPQRALSGVPVTDSTLARPPAGTLIGRLAVESISSSRALAGREVPIITGGACGQGYGTTYGLMSPAEKNVNCGGWLRNVTVRDLALRGSGWYGDLLSLGGVWDGEVDNVFFDNGFCNMGSPRMGASTYPVTLSNLRFGYSFGASYFAHCHDTDAHNFTFLQPVQNTVTTVGSNFRMHAPFVSASLGRYTMAHYAEESGGNYRIIGVEIDNEGNVTPSVASVLVEVPWVERTGLTIDDYRTGSIGPRAAVVELRRVKGQPTKHYPVYIRGLQTDQGGCLIRTDHGGVSGVIDAESASPDQYPWLELTGGITTTDLTIRSYRYSVPPGRLSWTDTTILEVRRPVLGMPARYRCVRGGEYGTATPPAWRAEAIQDDGTGTTLGAVSTVSEAITAVISGIPATGGLYSDRSRNILLDYWLRGVAANPPAALVVQPSIYTRNPLDAGAFWYPKATITGGFAPATARGTTSTAVPTFTAPTADVSDLQSLLLLDGGGNVIWQARWAKALPGYRTDPVPTLAAGGIVVSGGAPSVGTPCAGLIDEFAGGFTEFVLNAETDFWHRGTALPVVGGLELGLSTLLANREGTINEPTGNGYARLPIAATNFAPAADGRSVLNTTKAFGAATWSDWPEVQSVFLRSIGLGRVLWTANLLARRTAWVGGPPLRFVAGALVVVK
jgi:hypothetical protein